MITLLSKIFPYDISEYIYFIIIEEYKNTILTGKLYYNCLLMEKHYNKYYEVVKIKGDCYDPYFDYTEILKICKFLKYLKIYFVDKNYYKYDLSTKNLIYNFKNTVDYICALQNNIYTYYHRNNIKKMMKLSVKEII